MMLDYPEYEIEYKGADPGLSEEELVAEIEGEHDHTDGQD